MLSLCHSFVKPCCISFSMQQRINREKNDFATKQHKLQKKLLQQNSVNCKKIVLIIISPYYRFFSPQEHDKCHLSVMALLTRIHFVFKNSRKDEKCDCPQFHKIMRKLFFTLCSWSPRPFFLTRLPERWRQQKQGLREPVSS